ncbi:MAG: hypothetical protein HYV63_24915 [Candidatus Schekmanbacteria bacterium]|nr:hypothetical protein [Candidatus Schekmanbacteria bacterium]
MSAVVRMTAAQWKTVGVFSAYCVCCEVARELVQARDLGLTLRRCPGTGALHEDRGDGVYELASPEDPQGGRAPVLLALGSPVRPGDGAQARHGETGSPAAGAAAANLPELDLLSDRPKKTEAKTRISLEQATFAGAPRRL